MIPKEAISRAIEEGWGVGKTETPRELIPLFLQEHPEREYQVILDPEFWQALGKSCGWDEGKIERELYPKWPWQWMWQHIAHEFYDLILTGCSTDEFWEEILK